MSNATIIMAAIIMGVWVPFTMMHLRIVRQSYIRS